MCGSGDQRPQISVTLFLVIFYWKRWRIVFCVVFFLLTFICSSCSFTVDTIPHHFDEKDWWQHGALRLPPWLPMLCCTLEHSLLVILISSSSLVIIWSMGSSHSKTTNSIPHIKSKACFGYSPRPLLPPPPPRSVIENLDLCCIVIIYVNI